MTDVIMQHFQQSLTNMVDDINVAERLGDFGALVNVALLPTSGLMVTSRCVVTLLLLLAFSG